MKSENLEPLLLDHALGELSPEVAELLEAYLSRDDAAARQAAALHTTLRVAREALDRPVPTAAPPPLPRLRPTPAVRFRFAWTHWGELAKLAAGVALGLVLGRTLWMGPSGSTEPHLPVSVRVVVPAVAPVPEAGFWSLARQAAVLSRQTDRTGVPDHAYKLHWGSPLKIPRVEENP